MAGRTPKKLNQALGLPEGMNAEQVIRRQPAPPESNRIAGELYGQEIRSQIPQGTQIVDLSPAPVAQPTQQQLPQPPATAPAGAIHERIQKITDDFDAYVEALDSIPLQHQGSFNELLRSYQAGDSDREATAQRMGEILGMGGQTPMQAQAIRNQAAQMARTRVGNQTKPTEWVPTPQVNRESPEFQKQLSLLQKTNPVAAADVQAQAVLPDANQMAAVQQATNPNAVNPNTEIERAAQIRYKAAKAAKANVSYEKVLAQVASEYASDYDPTPTYLNREYTAPVEDAVIPPIGAGGGGGASPPQPPTGGSSGGGTPPPRKPVTVGGEGWNPPDALPPGSWDGERFVQPPLAGVLMSENPTLNEQLSEGWRRGWKYGLGDGHWSRSAITDRAPEDLYVDLDGAGRAAFLGARVAGDFAGYGSRRWLWRIHPEDVSSTVAGDVIRNAGGSRTAQVLTTVGASAALGNLSNNWNITNLGEGMRPTGFAATEPNDDDPRKTDNLALEYFNRGVLGRTGKLLPWEQFTQERPDVSYDQYEQYQQYLRDQGPLFGVVKGTWDGIDGPEARIAGYRVTPEGALAAAGVIGGAAMAVKALKRRGL